MYPRKCLRSSLIRELSRASAVDYVSSVIFVNENENENEKNDENENETKTKK